MYLGSWFIFLIFFYTFMFGPVSLLMHRLTSKTSETMSQEISGVSTNGKRFCRNSVELTGNSILWQRHVCGMSRTSVESLKPGEQIEISGTVSDFGIEVERFDVAQPDSVDR